MLPQKSLCLGQMKINISSITDNRNSFLHPCKKGLITLVDIVAVLNKRHDLVIVETLWSCCPKVVIVVPHPEDNTHARL